MSEQTPTSTEDLTGAEPSMEDILASIRKIISEDEPVALESPEDVQPVELVAAESPVIDSPPLSSFGQIPADTASDLGAGFAASEGDSVDLNIDDVLASLESDDIESTDNFTSEDLQIPEIPADASEDFSVEDLMASLDEPVEAPVATETGDDVYDFLEEGGATVSDIDGAAADLEVAPDLSADLSEALSSNDEISDLLEPVQADVPDIEIPEIDIPQIDIPQTDFAATDLAEASVGDDNVEMDALLDDILLTPEETPEEFSVETAEASLEDIQDEYVSEPEVLSEAEQSDLDLVKSLLAELADDPSGYEAEAELDAVLDVEDMELAAEAPATDFVPEAVIAEEPEEDILGDILDMSLEDELSGQSEDLDLGDLASLEAVAAAEQENILENILEDVAPTIEEAVPAIDEAVVAETVAELPSLAEIAAAAEADALAVEASAASQPLAAVGITAAGVGLAAVSAKVAGQSDADAEIAESEAVEIEAALNEMTEFESAEADIIEAEAAAPVEATTDLDIPAVETAQETPKNTLSTQETSMPVKAVKTDTIIDEVTETATAGAFAELNQVVEDKAVFNERGPRIGDLVQDALRPMLKEWLDANLKGIVERAVTKEVKRISKGQ